MPACQAPATAARAPAQPQTPARRDIETIAGWLEDWSWEDGGMEYAAAAARLREMAASWADDDERSRIAANALRALLTRRET